MPATEPVTMTREGESRVALTIHHLGKGRLGILFEPLAPGSARVCKENINVIGCLLNLGDKSVQVVHARVVGGDGNGYRAGTFIGEGIQGGDGLIAGFGFTGGDVDL
ncbi:hypothetical protein GB937_006573 [Aspergillus fischeri]|nr:hypothetical protein GB937_006573 [Aspergillus fischeri]